MAYDAGDSITFGGFTPKTTRTAWAKRVKVGGRWKTKQGWKTNTSYSPWQQRVSQYTVDPNDVNKRIENPLFNQIRQGGQYNGQRITWAKPPPRRAPAPDPYQEAGYKQSMVDANAQLQGTLNNLDLQQNRSANDYSNAVMQMAQAAVRGRQATDQRAQKLGVLFSQGRDAARGAYEDAYAQRRGDVGLANLRRNEDFAAQRAAAQSDFQRTGRTAFESALQRLAQSDATNGQLGGTPIQWATPNKKFQRLEQSGVRAGHAYRLVPTGGKIVVKGGKKVRVGAVKGRSRGKIVVRGGKKVRVGGRIGKQYDTGEIV